ncbi:TPA: hypothetical protein O8U62_002075 [Enterobacter kobei]|nr:hypothetical protein [Enterobacter kobei]
MNYKILRYAIVYFAFFLSGCAHHEVNTLSAGGPGFFEGLLHGFIAPFSFIGGLWDNTIAIYSVPNTGKWYDLGFIFGIGGLSSGCISFISSVLYTLLKTND